MSDEEIVRLIIKTVTEGLGMSRQHHYVKCETEYFQARERGEKVFEIRRNDRDYKKHDSVHLQESVNGIKTGREISMEIKYIMYGGQFGLDGEYCIFN